MNCFISLFFFLKVCVTMIFSHVFPLDSLVINHLHADLISIKLTHTSGHLILIKSTCKRLITSESGGFPLKFSVGDWDVTGQN